MRKKLTLSWYAVWLTGVVLVWSSPAGAAVTTVSDTFAEGGSAERGDGDPLDGVATEQPVAPDEVLWQASNLAFDQPGGVVTNPLQSDVGTNIIKAFVPIDGSGFPIGTTYTLTTDIQFQQADGVDTPVNFVQVGFIASGVLNDAFAAAGSGSVFVRIWGNGSIELLREDVVIATQNHANYTGASNSDLIADGYLDLDALNTIAIVYEEFNNTVSVEINNNPIWTPRLNLGQRPPTIGKAGLNCAAQVLGGGRIPVETVTVDDFTVTADDGTQVTVVEGPVNWAGHTYYLLSPAAWITSQRAAEALGGNLITIDSPAEQQWMIDMWGSYDISALGLPACGTTPETCMICDYLDDDVVDLLWIGYHQEEPVGAGLEPAGGWVWASGSDSSYTQWMAGRPWNNTVCPVDAGGGGGSPANVAVTGAFFGNDWTDWATYSTAGIMGVVEVDGLLNNGWRMDWVYCAQRADVPANSTNPDRGSMRAYQEITGELMTPAPDYFLPGGDVNNPGAGWNTLTFGGSRDNNDAAMYVAKAIPVDNDFPTDVEIARIDATGQTVQTVNLSTLLGSSPGVKVAVGTLRFSIFHNALFLGINPDHLNTVANPAMVYEIDPGLTTIVNIYTGPTCWMGGPMLDIDPFSGMMYITSQSMGSASHDEQGNVYAIDTTVPTATPQLIIDSTTVADWRAPNGLIFRGDRNPDGVPTLIVKCGGGTDIGNAPQIEFYVDDLNNVTERMRFNDQRGPTRGSRDDFSALTYHPRFLNNKNFRGVSSLSTDDVWTFQDYGHDPVNALGWQDAASPGFQPDCGMDVLPADTQVVDVNPGQSADDVILEIVNSGVTDDINYSITVVPADTTWLSLDKTSGGPLAPGATDTVTASLSAAGLDPGEYVASLILSNDCGNGSETVRTIRLNVLECTWDVSPQTTDPVLVPGDLTVYGDCNGDMSYPFTITNVAGLDLSYTVEEVDVNGNSTDYGWLQLDKAAGGPIASGTVDTVMATILSDGSEKTGYVKFTPSCGVSSTGVGPVIRRIDVLVVFHNGRIKSFSGMYMGDVSPTDADSCGPGCTFEQDTGTVAGTVVSDPDATNGSAYYISQVETGQHGYASVNLVGGDITRFIDARVGTTMVGRIKVTHDINAGPMMWVRNDGRAGLPNAGYGIGWGGAGPSHAGQVRDFRHSYLDNAERTSAQLATTSEEQNAYHIIRVLNGYGPYGDRVVKVFYDEDPTPVLSMENLATISLFYLPEGFVFGTFGGIAEADVYFDWISFTNKGMYAPGQEDACLGPNSLIPQVCSDPFADADGDGDVDQDDFADFQICFTSLGGGVPEGCLCFDADKDGDIDPTDFSMFENCASGPAVPADPSCDDVP